ncbi:hypothetical protein IGI66_003572 [Enterococcus sp. AZ048]|uniref:MucBP domain-containing protein n=1 Tax=Enterococcus sp. AZ048 TaxID=2774658 RepID=UPI003F201F18
MKKSVKLVIMVMLLQGVYPIQNVFGATTSEDYNTQADSSMSSNNADNNKIESIDSWMPDKSLQQRIITTMGLTNSDELTKDKIGELDSINLDPSIINLEGLQYAESLHLVTFEPLGNLNYLYNLDYSPLYNLRSLSSLQVDNESNPFSEPIHFDNIFKRFFENTKSESIRSGGIEMESTASQRVFSISRNNYKEFSIPLSEFFVKPEGFPLNSPDRLLAFGTEYESDSMFNIEVNGIPLNYNVKFNYETESYDFTLKNDVDYNLIKNMNSGYSNFDSIEYSGEDFTSNLNTIYHFEYIDFELESLLSLSFKDLSTVKVKYVDTAGTPIAGVSEETLTGDIGEAYTTEQKVIDGYTFKEVQGSPTGVFSDQPQTVTYVYSKNPVKGADVKVNYVDTAGNQIADVSNETLSGNIGETYTTEQKAIEGYTFKEVQGNAKGVFTSEPQTVTYIYTKNPVIPVAGGDVTVKYQDKEGTKLAPDATKSGNVGETYTTEQQAIEGYTFKEIQGNAKGAFTSEPQTVTYIYTKNTPAPVKPDQAQKVTVNYVDDSGKAVADAILLSGKINEAYTSEAKKIEGYTLIKTPENEKGFFTDKEQTVTYVYKKNSAAPTNNHGNSQQKTTTFYTGVSRGGENYTGKSYPKTGDQDNVIYALVGLMILFLIGVYEFLRRKKKS